MRLAKKGKNIMSDYVKNFFSIKNPWNIAFLVIVFVILVAAASIAFWETSKKFEINEHGQVSEKLTNEQSTKNFNANLKKMAPSNAAEREEFKEKAGWSL